MQKRAIAPGENDPPSGPRAPPAPLFQTEATPFLRSGHVFHPYDIITLILFVSGVSGSVPLEAI
jgi:hypothetical protein